MAPLRPADDFKARFNELVDERCVGSLTQQRLAEKIPCHPNMIRHWKRGTHSPRDRNLRRIAAALEVPVSELAVGLTPAATTTPDQSPAGQPRELQLDAADLLARLAGLELETSIRKLSEAAPHLEELQGAVPDLLDLLSEARQRTEESGR